MMNTDIASKMSMLGPSGPDCVTFIPWLQFITNRYLKPPSSTHPHYGINPHAQAVELSIPVW